MSTRPDPSMILSAPLDAARSLLVVPVRAVREAAVLVARTARHWELVLEDGDGADGGRATAASDGDGRSGEARRVPDYERMVWDTESPARPDAEAADLPPAKDVTDARELPVEEWPQLSLADAQARSSSCSPTELATLLAYEQQHGHRAAFELMLQQRLRQAVS